MINYHCDGNVGCACTACFAPSTTHEGTLLGRWGARVSLTGTHKKLLCAKKAIRSAKPANSASSHSKPVHMTFFSVDLRIRGGSHPCCREEVSIAEIRRGVELCWEVSPLPSTGPSAGTFRVPECGHRRPDRDWAALTLKALTVQL